MVVQVHPGVEARPARAAGSRAGPVVGEQDTAGGQRVEGRRLEEGMAEGRQGVASPLVERDEQDAALPVDHGRTSETTQLTGWPAATGGRSLVQAEHRVGRQRDLGQAGRALAGRDFLGLRPAGGDGVVRLDDEEEDGDGHAEERDDARSARRRRGTCCRGS